jgi:hypothetical protein
MKTKFSKFAFFFIHTLAGYIGYGLVAMEIEIGIFRLLYLIPLTLMKVLSLMMGCLSAFFALNVCKVTFKHLQKAYATVL